MNPQWCKLAMSTEAYTQTAKILGSSSIRDPTRKSMKYAIEHCGQSGNKYSVLSIYRGHFSLYKSRKAPRSSPVKGEVWGVVRERKSDRIFIIMIVVLCTLSHHIYIYRQVNSNNIWLVIS